MKQKYGEAFLSDFLEFNEVEVEDSEIQNLQDADEVPADDFEMDINNMFDRSRKSGDHDMYRSDLDLRKPKDAYHFGMLSIHTDSQDNIQTVNNDGSFKILQLQGQSVGDQTNKSQLQAQKTFNIKTLKSPIAQESQFQDGGGQELNSNESKATFIVANQYENLPSYRKQDSNED